jgi:hypothetical protein
LASGFDPFGFSGNIASKGKIIEDDIFEIIRNGRGQFENSQPLQAAEVSDLNINPEAIFVLFSIPLGTCRNNALKTGHNHFQIFFNLTLTIILQFEVILYNL